LECEFRKGGGGVDKPCYDIADEGLMSCVLAETHNDESEENNKCRSGCVNPLHYEVNNKGACSLLPCSERVSVPGSSSPCGSSCYLQKDGVTCSVECVEGVKVEEEGVCKPVDKKSKNSSVFPWWIFLIMGLVLLMIIIIIIIMVLFKKRKKKVMNEEEEISKLSESRESERVTNEPQQQQQEILEVEEKIHSACDDVGPENAMALSDQCLDPVIHTPEKFVSLILIYFFFFFFCLFVCWFYFFFFLIILNIPEFSVKNMVVTFR
jgi:ATP-dependent Zn protease